MDKTIWSLYGAACGYTQAKEEHEQVLSDYPPGHPNRRMHMRNIRELAAARATAEAVALKTLAESLPWLRERIKT